MDDEELEATNEVEKEKAEQAAARRRETAQQQSAEFGSGWSLDKLKSGEFGLAKTYWIYCVLVNVLVGFVAKLTPIGWMSYSLVIVHALYSIFVLLGLWAASDKYKGFFVWAILAKMLVVFGWGSMAILVYLGATL